MDASVRILFVDGTDAGEEAAHTLQSQRERFAVEWVRGAADARDAVADQQFDCLVSAYHLPDSDGVELLAAIRTDDIDIPFVLFPEDGDEAIASAVFAGGGSGYLGREAGAYDTLAERITDLVDQSQRTRGYHTLVDSSPVPMFVIDQSFEIVYANPSAADTLGDGDRDTLVGEDVLTFVPKSDHEPSVSRIESVFETREPTDVREYQYLTHDGETRIARGTIVPVTFEGIDAAQVVLVDLTDSKHRERRLETQRQQIARLHDVGVELAGCRSPEEVYELTVEAAEDILDLDLCIVGIVEEGRLKLGESSREMDEEGYIEPPVNSEDAGLAGKSFREQVSYHIDDLAGESDANPVQDYRSCIVTPIGEFGTFQAVSYEVAAFSELELELVEILSGHAREALTRLEQERQLRDQRDRLTRENERLEEFASIVSHDLRNPLDVIKGRLTFLEDKTDDEHATVALESVQRMETLIDDLLTLAREGETVSEFEPVDLATVVGDSWDTVETREATLDVEADCVVSGDDSRIQELLANLIRNAIEHGTDDPEAAELTISVGELDDDSGFYIADDGAGLSPEAQDRLFESGFSTSEKGTGFGLAIVNRIVRAHDWEIRATDSDAGGTKFEITGVETVARSSAR